jgi:hypothetical protein
MWLHRSEAIVFGGPLDERFCLPVWSACQVWLCDHSGYASNVDGTVPFSVTLAVAYCREGNKGTYIVVWCCRGVEGVWIDDGDTKLPQGGASFFPCILFNKPRSGLRIGGESAKLWTRKRRVIVESWTPPVVVLSLVAYPVERQATSWLISFPEPLGKESFLPIPSICVICV